jgi:hypothetical protein
VHRDVGDVAFVAGVHQAAEPNHNMAIKRD